jgi:hypothetical protein
VVGVNVEVVRVGGALITLKLLYPESLVTNCKEREEKKRGDN